MDKTLLYKPALLGLVLLLAYFAGISSGILVYAAIAIFVFIAVEYFRAKFPPPRISKKRRKQLDKKYERYPLIVDGLSLALMVIEILLLYFLLKNIKLLVINTPGNAIYLSNPQGEIFLVAFLLSLSSIGWIIDSAAKIALGSDYWNYYYNQKYVGFNTKKVYKVVSIAAFLLAMPLAYIGLKDASYITSEGIFLHSWKNTEIKNYSWEDVAAIKKVSNKNSGFYVILFKDGTEWNTSNERWNSNEEEVIYYIKQKAGIN